MGLGDSPRDSLGDSPSPRRPLAKGYGPSTTTTALQQARTSGYQFPRASEMSVGTRMNEKPGEYVFTLFDDENETEKKEDTQSLAGTFLGVYMPTCLMFWGVIIFARFGEITGQAGIGLAFLAAFLSALNVTLTTSSVSALASNGVQSSTGGIYHLLTRSLGSPIGGAISILYCLGLTVMSTCEIVGFSEAMRRIVLSEAVTFITGSYYFDQLIYSVGGYALMIFFVCCGQTFTYVLGTAILVLVMSAYASSFAGLFASATGWAVGDYFDEFTNTTFTITGLTTGDFVNNLTPKFSGIYDFKTVMSFIFPTFICIFKGANAAHTLKTPDRSIPLGAFGAIATSLSFYTFIFCLLGAVAPRDTVKGYYLMFGQVAWPHRWVNFVGFIVVGPGSCIELIQMAMAVLQSIAADDIIPFLRRLRLHEASKDGVPSRALFVVALFACPFLFVPNLDFIATIVTMLFCLAYAAVNFSCFLLSVLQAPSWRPKFRYYHRYFTAFPGFILSMTIMFMINWITALVATGLLIVLAVYIEVNGNSNVWGQGVYGLKMHIALEALYQIEEDAAAKEATRLMFEELGEISGEISGKFPAPGGLEGTSEPDMVNLGGNAGDGGVSKKRGVGFAQAVTANPADAAGAHVHVTESLDVDSPILWRPQVLVMLSMPTDTTLHPTSKSLLGFVRTLTKSSAKGGLIMAGHVMTTQSGEGAGARGIRARRRKTTLQGILKEHKLSGFVEVIQAPNEDVGTTLLLQTAGLGCLKPNTIVCAWPEMGQNPDPAVAKSVLSLVVQARADNQAILLVKGVDTFPPVQSKARGCLDIWWVVQDGGLLLLVGHLLRTHKTWRNCTLRLFTVVRPGMNTPLVEKRIKSLLEALRILAQVHVVEVGGPDLQPFLNEFTITKAALPQSHRRLTEVFMAQSEIASSPDPPIKIDPIHEGTLHEPINDGDSSATSKLGKRNQVTMTVPPLPLIHEQELQTSQPTAETLENTEEITEIRCEDGESMRKFGFISELPGLKLAMERESSNSALVILNLPVPNRESQSHADEYVQLVDGLTQNLPRCVLAQGLGDGTQVLSVFNV